VGQVAIITRVADGREADLERFLAGLPRDAPPTAAGHPTTPPSPFNGVLPPTHFARFVVIKLDRDQPYLFFSSAFDGDTIEYLRALAATPQALDIWSHCHVSVGDETLTSAALERYLCDSGNWRPAQYVVSAISDDVSVAQINRALSLRAQLGALMARAGALDPIALAHDFRQLPAVHALMSRR
jgi:hypothetical protein